MLIAENTHNSLWLTHWMWPRKSILTYLVSFIFVFIYTAYMNIGGLKGDTNTVAVFDLWNKIYLQWDILLLKFLGVYAVLIFFYISSTSNAAACHCLVVVAVTREKCLSGCQRRATWALSRDKEMVKGGGKTIGKWIFCGCYSITIYVIE